jgi:outer membrane protein assembly factor BamA
MRIPCWLVGLLAGLAPALAWAQADTAALQQLENRTVTSIELTGLEHTRPHIVTRELETSVGLPLRLDVLKADVQRLENLAIFGSVAATGRLDGEGVAVTLAFKESIRGFAYPTLSYAEVNGWSFGAAATWRNLFGRNASVSGRAVFGGTTSYGFGVANPWVAGNHVGFDVRFAYLERFDKLNEFHEKSAGLAPRVSTYLGSKGRLAASVGFFQMRSDVAGKTLSPSNQDRFVRAGVVLGYDSRDSWRDPRRGWQNEVDLWRTAGGGDYWSMDLDLRRFQPVGERKLEVSGLLSLQSGKVGRDVPEYLLYRVGGTNSIRGYRLDTLGREIYGKNQLLTTAEYVFTVVPLRLVNPRGHFSLRVGVEGSVFADAGTAWSAPNELALDRFRAGLGAGLRILVPGIEQLRLELGWSPSGGFVVHFASGAKIKKQRDRLR